MTGRWPLHPAPTTGEALSSWLARVAAALQVDDDILVHDLGYHLPDRAGLDLAPPDGFVERLSERTGVPTDQIRAMSLAGYRPWLIEDLDPLPGGFTTYTRQLSVLLPPGRLRDRDVPSWRAWLPVDRAPRARVCPRCVPDTAPPHPYQLMWSIPLMLTCPLHHCLLQPYDGGPGWYLYLSGGRPEPVTASTAVQDMDAWTWQALTDGQVNLPGRRVHAGIWFRLLRTLLDELGATVTECGAARALSRRVWDQAGHRVRAGQQRWRPYEDLPPIAQDQTLEAAATAIQTLRVGVLPARGRDAALLAPERHVPTDPGKHARRPARHDEPTVQDWWRQVHDSMAECLDAARRDPRAAQQLFAIATFYRHDAAYLARVRANFAELGIPLEVLSRN